MPLSQAIDVVVVVDVVVCVDGDGDGDVAVDDRACRVCLVHSVHAQLSKTRRVQVRHRVPGTDRASCRTDSKGKRHVAGSVTPRGKFDFPPHRGSGWPYRSGRCRADLRNRSRVCDGVRGCAGRIARAEGDRCQYKTTRRRASRTDRGDAHETVSMMTPTATSPSPSPSPSTLTTTSTSRPRPRNVDVALFPSSCTN